MRTVTRTDRVVKMASVTTRVRYWRSTQQGGPTHGAAGHSASQPLRGPTRSVPERPARRRADPCFSVAGDTESR